MWSQSCKVAPLSVAPPASPRVLVVTNMYPTPEDPTYGAFVASQVGSLQALGVSVEVVFINGKRSGWEYADAPLSVRKRLRQKSFDVVHAHYGLTAFVTSVVPTPLVVSFCGDDLLGTPDGHGGITVKSRMVRWLSLIAARRADAIICKSEELRQVLPRVQDRVRAQVIPNGVDVRLFRPGDRTQARRRLRLASGERVVLFPSTPTERRKRLDLAEAAVRELEKRGVRVRLLVLHGVLPSDMPDHYWAADCLLLTSDWEGSPNVVKEALCCDLPVVSVDAGDVRRWIALTPGCHIVERSPTALARALEEVLGGPGRVDGQHVREIIGADRVARSILAVYCEALKRRHR